LSTAAIALSLVPLQHSFRWFAMGSEATPITGMPPIRLTPQRSTRPDKGDVDF
jgi:hypothetical protein